MPSDCVTPPFSGGADSCPGDSPAQVATIDKVATAMPKIQRFTRRPDDFMICPLRDLHPAR